jgi:2-polyprenyl-3-methyl-5-hydroxy-6-metoxy-1,4-benzoquinol methylase
METQNDAVMLFKMLETINCRPAPFEVYTAEELWANEHTSEKMLQYHLNPDIDVSSRKTAFIDNSVNWISSHFNIGKGSCVIDFGCGPGLYSTRLARCGAQVTGIDFSKRSVEYARGVAAQEGLSINYRNQNYLTFDTGETFDLIIMIMCDYCALSPVQRSTMLSKFRKMLKPNGAVLLDVYSMEMFGKIKESSLYEVNQQDGFWDKEKYYAYVNTFKYIESSVVLDKYTIVTDSKIKTVYNWLQYFSLQELKKEFERCGLNVVEQYANVAGSEFIPDSDEFAIVAKKV